LADELKTGGYDLILFGKMSPDSSNGVVGPMSAELLGLPCVTAISSLEIADRKGKAKRELEGAQEIVEFPLPAVLTVDEGLNTARMSWSSSSTRASPTTVQRSQQRLPPIASNRADTGLHYSAQPRRDATWPRA